MGEVYGVGDLDVRISVILLLRVLQSTCSG